MGKDIVINKKTLARVTMNSIADGGGRIIGIGCTQQGMIKGLIKYLEKQGVKVTG